MRPARQPLSQGCASLDRANSKSRSHHRLRFFPSKLSAGPTLVVDRHNVARGHDWWRSPNGSGPYRLEEWQPESRITLRRAATATWLPGGPAVVEFIQLDVGEDLLLYESDALDLVAIGGSDLDRFRDPNEPRSGHLLSTPDLAFHYVGFNTTLAPLDDEHVRRALALATDRAFINEVVLTGTQREANGVIPPGLPGHRPDFEGLSFDLTAAAAELRRVTLRQRRRRAADCRRIAWGRPLRQSIPRVRH